MSASASETTTGLEAGDPGVSGRCRRVLVVGPGMRFASGISAYTVRLANALAEEHDVSVLLLRELLPRRLFPGRDRVGHYQSSLHLSPGIEVCDGLNWYLLPSLLKVAGFVRRAQPEVIVMPWWTGAAAHMELIIALLNLAVPRARLVLEMHETMDGIEDSVPLLRFYSRITRRLLARMAVSFLVHSEAEKQQLLSLSGFKADKVFVVPHGTYDHLAAEDRPQRAKDAPVTYVFFGLVRPYKGVERLVDAFSALPPEVAARSRLLIAGEVWEGTTEPRRRAEASPYAASISFMDRYLADAEVSELFAAADVAVFPYLRASQSGAVRVAMAAGIPVVASDVGGLGEACAEYSGAVLVAPGDVEALTAGLLKARDLTGVRHADPYPWSRTVEAFDGLFEHVFPVSKP